ncbi:MAG TPA: hybrid sensor histidine kinase/response regulator transcription factor [Ktedonobacteraceae bacterium]|nr:hybrid sensor histidine kinase/response regulator transcription factor [Ktedonobacteraceae bacterium]
MGSRDPIYRVPGVGGKFQEKFCMAASDKLLQLIADLQRGMTAVHGRRALLEYARASSGARLALLFVLDKERQRLVLLKRCGRRLLSQTHHPRQVSPSSTASDSKKKQLDTTHISIHGLFGSALETNGLSHISHAFTDPRTLEEEQYWIGRDNGHLILGTIGNQQGVLVLCFDVEDKPSSDPHDRQQAVTEEGNLLVCTTLLSTYLSIKEGASSRKGPHSTSSPPPPLRDDAPSQAFSKKSAPNLGTDTQQSAKIVRQLAELYEIKLKAAIDQERNRIAHDIHDGAAQHIAHAAHKLEFIQRIFEKQPELAQRELDRTVVLLKEGLNDLRHGISSLIPVQLEEQGFVAALQSLLSEHMQDEPGLKIGYEGDNLALLPHSLEISIYRFIQEALNNVRKHAQATRVTIRIRILTNILLIEVSDNGHGFDVEQVLGNVGVPLLLPLPAGNADTPGGIPPSMGLRTMRERVQQAGGSWEFQSKRGEGTTVKARFPFGDRAAVLTNREREVLQLLAEGLTNRAIAEKLSVSTETIKSHVHHIMQKMQVNDRTLVAVRATKQRWL